MWQCFLDEQGERLAFLSVAVDVEPERARPFAERCPFTTVVDSTGVLGRQYDFDVVPNGLFLDEAGIVRYLHVGGFDVRRPEIVQQVEALIAANFEAGAAPAFSRQEPLELEVIRTGLLDRPDDADLRFALGDALMRAGRFDDAEAAFRCAAELNPADWSAPFALGTVEQRRGRTDAALEWWRRALANDPANFLIRKQIWRAEHPERFGDAIDFAWQRAQLEREGYRR